MFDSVWGGNTPPEGNTAWNKGRKCFHCLGATNNLIRPWLFVSKHYSSFKTTQIHTRFKNFLFPSSATNFFSLLYVHSQVFLFYLRKESYLMLSLLFLYTEWAKSTYIVLYRVSQEECVTLWEGVPYVQVYRYNPKHLYPKLNGYGDNGQRSLKVWQLLHTYWLPNT